MESFGELLRIMDVLTGENGCPWDKAQTFESLKKSLLGECNEVIEAVDENNADGVCEELGDVLMNVLLYAKVAEKNGAFTFEDVVRAVSEKLVERHSHIFGNDVALTEADAERVWNENKRKFS